MRSLTAVEHYEAFLSYVDTHIQGERRQVNRRMLSVFLWSFFLPALMAVVILIGARLGFLPRSSRAYVESIMLIFPISYALYFLGAEVLSQLPQAMRRGGLSASLDQSRKESVWRGQVAHGLGQALGQDPALWKLTVAGFRRDLGALEHRTRYLTALAGAVLFVILQGVDLISDGETPVTLIKSSQGSWMEVSSANPDQWVALGLFLVLFYLAGMQSAYQLRRYLSCAELILVAAGNDSREVR